MKNIVWFLFFLPVVVFGQKMKKADKQIVESVKASITYLADDKLEGRRAGSPGEALAISYITDKFTKAGLSPKGDNNSFLQPFTIDEGREINKKTSFFRVDGKDLDPGTEFYPMGYSPDSKMIEAASAVSVPEKGVPWFINLAEGLIANKDNPHFDQPTWIRNQVKNAYDKGATAVVLYNTMDSAADLKYDGKDKSEKTTLPVIYVTRNAFAKYFSDPEATYDFKLKVETSAKTRTANNVVGYIDNGAPTTVVLGAHFDHLGYGEDGNSMIRTGEKLIHNGADDNASGTAALLELASLLKKSKLKKQNYLFIAFSGEELGLLGSSYVANNFPLPIENDIAMINMDMIGRLNDKNDLIVYGTGTSSKWKNILDDKNEYDLNLTFNDEGFGPSDHSSFYGKKVPVLFFFTGTHSDYHKPSDDADKINSSGEEKVLRYVYDVAATIVNSDTRPDYISVERKDTGKMTGTRVYVGTVPDFAGDVDGYKLGGVTDGSPAAKAGLLAGDIIIKFGEKKISNIYDFTYALGDHVPGDKVNVLVKRGNEELTFEIELGSR